MIKEFSSNRSFNAQFEDYRETDSLLYPYHIRFEIKAQKNIDINMEYNKVISGNPQTFPFSIPGGFERIQYKEK